MSLPITTRCHRQAIREYHTDTGPADFVFFLGPGNPVGVIQAKKEDFGQNLTTVADQIDKNCTENLDA